MEKKRLMLTKASSGVKVFVSHTHPEVHITDDFVEATDGYILVRVYHRPDDGQFPETPGNEFEEKINLLIPAENFNIKLPTKIRHPFQGNACLTRDEDYILVTTIHNENTITSRMLPSNGIFPDAGHVLKDREGEMKLVIDAHLLKKLVDYAVKVSDKKITCPIAFYINTKNPEDHIRFEFETSIDTGSQRIEGALMPMKLDSV